MSDFDKSHRLQLAVSLSALGLLAAGVWFSRRRSTGPSSENPNPSPTKSEPAPTTPVKRDDRGDVSPVSTRATPSGTAPERAPKYGNLVVNYFYQRRCNYGCKFCFHTEKSLPVSDIEQQLAGDCSSSNDAPRAAHLSLPDKKQALANLKEHDMIRVTFSGGEPFWSPLELGQLVDYCKCELRVEVSIVSNGSLIQERWMKKHGKNVDVGLLGRASMLICKCCFWVHFLSMEGCFFWESESPFRDSFSKRALDRFAVMCNVMQSSTSPCTSLTSPRSSPSPAIPSCPPTSSRSAACRRK